jgi:branched-chain amino acid transport system substrate-binding protein
MGKCLSLMITGMLTCTLACAEILVGQTAGLTGPTAAAMKEINEGANLYFDAINQSGGIQNRPIRMISLDDKFDPKLAAQNAQQLANQKDVLLLFLTRGTAQTEALLPILVKNEIPLLAPSTGAMSLHEPVNPFVYNVRATYQNEASKGIVQLHSTGTTKVAIIYRDDSFGKDGLAGAEKGFTSVGLKPLFIEKVDRNKADFTESIAKARTLNPQAIMIFESPVAVARAVIELRTAGVLAQVITLSNCATQSFIQALGAHARGVIVTQVFPGERALGVPMIAELHNLAQSKNIKLSPATVEGFAAAKVLVEALRRLKSNPTRKGLMTVLDSISRYDLGGMYLSFSPTDHTGLQFADLSIISAEGKFLR